MKNYVKSTKIHNNYQFKLFKRHKKGRDRRKTRLNLKMCHINWDGDERSIYYTEVVEER